MSSSASRESLFSLLPRTRTPWAEFVCSTGAQALAVAALIWVRLLLPVPALHEFNSQSVVLVSTPQPVNHQPQPAARIRFTERASADVSIVTLPPVERAKVRSLPDDEAPAPKVMISAQKLDLPLASKPLIPRPAIETGVFSTGSSAPATTARMPEGVQTGGFGDPNGIPTQPSVAKPVNIGARGSFDLPSDSGHGNGTAGAKGVAGVVVSAGFGNGTAIGDPRGYRSQSSVRASGFTSANFMPASATRGHAAEEAAKLVPAEILFKPVPSYTQEARALRIEGEVLLEAVLEANGRLRVVRVVSGLGHGLDVNAIKAAEQIRFKPALRDGQPSDSTVVLHIIFQMA